MKIKPKLSLPVKSPCPTKEALMAQRALEDSARLKEQHNAELSRLRRSAGFID